MKNSKMHSRLLCFKLWSAFIVLALLVSLPGTASAFTYLWYPPVTLDWGIYLAEGKSSLAVVDGKPVITYFDSTDKLLKFKNAKDANGFAWNTTKNVGASVGAETYFSSLSVGGVLGICYNDSTNFNLHFVKATSSEGYSWNTPITLDDSYHSGFFCSTTLIGGIPAVTYYSMGGKSIKYIQATDSSGNTWNTPVTVASNIQMVQNVSLVDLNGVPAVCYMDYASGEVSFSRATDATGTTWSTPIILEIDAKYSESSIALIAGVPAISYRDAITYELKFIKASDSTGSTWLTPHTFSSITSGVYSSLTSINGMPVIAYYESGIDELQFVQAKDSNGTEWNPPQILDSSGDVGRFVSMVQINGDPAISYYDKTNLAYKFIKSRGYSNISLLDGTDPISSSDTIDFGSTTQGSPLVKTITIQNNGSVSLDMLSLQLPDGYSLTGNYPQEIASGGSQVLQIHLDAYQTGTFTGNLQIGSNDAIQSPFSITLTGIVGAANREIAVTEGVTPIPDDTGSIDFGSTITGSPLTRTFTITNSGNVDLSLYRLSLPSGFSIIGSYSSTIAAGATTNITVQLDADTPGSYTGEFSLSNNDTDENPFHFTLSGQVNSAPGEITVLDGSIALQSGSSSMDLGATPLGTPLPHTFTIQNVGSNALDLGKITLPAGFSLVGSYDPSVASGASTTITVQLDALAAGTYSGAFSLVNDDTDENPFNFTIHGSVTNLTLLTPLIAPVNGSTVLNSSIKVAFNQDVLHDGSAEAANNPANYLLVEQGVNHAFDTATCKAGKAVDDVQVTITGVVYDSASYTATVNTGTLPSGTYQLLVCGTASIEGITGNVLNNGLSDSSTTFTVVAAGSNTGSTGGSSSKKSSSLPATGFAPGRVTLLPVQPASAVYDELVALQLQIPSLKVDVPIVGVPQTTTGWDVTWLSTAQVGWLNGTAFPTWEGNTVLTGHVTDANGNFGPFANIKNLKYGDVILVQGYGETHRYEVRENKLVSPDDTSVIGEHEDQSWVTLITCEYYYEETGTYLYRRVIRAVLVEIE
jgi:LPXTG-site transpeptidase (sortase) family protein